MAYPLPANLPDEFIFNVRYDFRRPFGTGSSAIDESSGTLLDQLPCGGQAGNIWLSYTHILVTNPNIDIRDGCSRTNGGNAMLYSDGDEVRVYTHFGFIRFVVVWVAYIPSGAVGETAFSGYNIVYLFRHSNVIV